MKHVLLLCSMAGVLVAAPMRGEAQTLSVSGNPPLLSVSTATAGAAPTAVSNASTTYRLTNSVFGSRIRARLSSPLPAGVTLRITLEAPPGATSMGAVTLTTTDQDVVRNIGIVTSSVFRITYNFSATSTAGVIPVAARSVTLTLSAF